jgi:hypothetical protein
MEEDRKVEGAERWTWDGGGKTDIGKQVDGDGQRKGQRGRRRTDRWRR